MITALSLSIEIITLLLEELNHGRSSSLLFLRPSLISPPSSDKKKKMTTHGQLPIGSAWVAWLVVENEGGLSNGTETHD